MGKGGRKNLQRGQTFQGQTDSADDSGASTRGNGFYTARSSNPKSFPKRARTWVPKTPSPNKADDCPAKDLALSEQLFTAPMKEETLPEGTVAPATQEKALGKISEKDDKIIPEAQKKAEEEKEAVKKAEMQAAEAQRKAMEAEQQLEDERRKLQNKVIEAQRKAREFHQQLEEERRKQDLNQIEALKNKDQKANISMEAQLTAAKTAAKKVVQAAVKSAVKQLEEERREKEKSQKDVAQANLNPIELQKNEDQKAEISVEGQQQLEEERRKKDKIQKDAAANCSQLDAQNSEDEKGELSIIKSPSTATTDANAAKRSRFPGRRGLQCFRTFFGRR